MATLNYITLKVPKILFDNISVIQKTPTFNVIKFMKKDSNGLLYTPKNGGMHDSMIVIFNPI